LVTTLQIREKRSCEIASGGKKRGRIFGRVLMTGEKGLPTENSQTPTFRKDGGGLPGWQEIESNRKERSKLSKLSGES